MITVGTWGHCSVCMCMDKDGYIKNRVDEREVCWRELMAGVGTTNKHTQTSCALSYSENI